MTRKAAERTHCRKGHLLEGNYRMKFGGNYHRGRYWFKCCLVCQRANNKRCRMGLTKPQLARRKQDVPL